MPRTIWKKIGETPLECLTRFRGELGLDKSVPMSYAGRLDPMAEGKLLILLGEECRNRDQYLNLDKEYEVEIVFGIQTDSYDALGLPKKGKDIPVSSLPMPDSGRFLQKYPPFSSKTIGGIALHSLARSGQLPETLPEKEVEIYSVSELARGEISSRDLKRKILEKIDSVKGDFRQKEIKRGWEEVLSEEKNFPFLHLSVSCSSGTYMRSLADSLGKKALSGAFALAIVRTEICSPD